MNNTRQAVQTQHRRDILRLIVAAMVASVIGLPAAPGLGIGAAAAQSAERLVKIGVMSDMSGAYSAFSGAGSVLAARMAVADFDPASKGLKVEIIEADHQNKPDVGASIARKWIAVDKVDVIVDVPVSSIAFAVSEVVRDTNKVFLPGASASS